MKRVVVWGGLALSLACHLGPGLGLAAAQSYDGYGSRNLRSPEHLNFLSPRCRSLYDAIRTAQIRGLNHDTQRNMQIDYREKCAEEEQQAMSRSTQQKRDQWQQQQERDKTDKLEAERSAQQTSARAEQCRESRRILASKRARTDLNDGEKADLNRFEENIHARCG